MLKLNIAFQACHSKPIHSNLQEDQVFIFHRITYKVKKTTFEIMAYSSISKHSNFNSSTYSLFPDIHTSLFIFRFLFATLLFSTTLQSQSVCRKSQSPL